MTKLLWIGWISAGTLFINVDLHRFIWICISENHLRLFIPKSRVYQDAQVIYTETFTSAEPKAQTPITKKSTNMSGLLDLDPNEVVLYVGGYPKDFKVNKPTKELSFFQLYFFTVLMLFPVFCQTFPSLCSGFGLLATWRASVPRIQGLYWVFYVKRSNPWLVQLSACHQCHKKRHVSKVLDNVILSHQRFFVYLADEVFISTSKFCITVPIFLP